jgi:hypothetical protein
VDFVVHFHGRNNTVAGTIEQFKLVEQFYAGGAISETNFEIDNIIISGHSGGYHVMAAILDHGGTMKPPADMMTNIDEYMRKFDSSPADKTPHAEMLQAADAMVFDLQDVGTRVYTYIATMACAMQAWAESGIKFFVLDRPNPVNGVSMEGAILEFPKHSSFIGLYPIPLRHDGGRTRAVVQRKISSENVSLPSCRWKTGRATSGSIKRRCRGRCCRRTCPRSTARRFTRARSSLKAQIYPNAAARRSRLNFLARHGLTVLCWRKN